jgi:2-C-methyl-D-erythritol 4-phosphate cytidylyltransferase
MTSDTVMSSRERYWVIIPAAGIGKRMRSDTPKQYLPLAGRSVLEHTLHRLSSHPMIAEIVVVIAQDDDYWHKLKLDWVAKPVSTVIGGDERCFSVLNGLQYLSQRAETSDWVMVHDAARPCIRPGDINLLISQCQGTDGGLLATQVRDTMKLSDANGQVAKTVDRNNLWHALTPQMFRYANLKNALENAIKAKQLVTDEAMAMEATGIKPKLVAGHADNIKITQPEDLALAAFYLQQQFDQGVGVFDDGMADGG